MNFTNREYQAKCCQCVWLTLLWLTASFALTGCASSLLGEEVVQRTYLLNAQVALNPRTQPSQQVLLVAEPRAEAGFDTSRIAYSKESAALEYYNQSRWVDTPARMLTPLLVNTIASSNAFRAVVSPPALVPVDLRLDLNLIRLQQEFFQQPSQVRVILRAKLIDVATSHILATQLFEAIEPSTSEDAQGGVQATNRAVARLLREITAFVLDHTPSATARG